jgi:hypothetical protein
MFERWGENGRKSSGLNQQNQKPERSMAGEEPTITTQEYCIDIPGKEPQD